MFGNWLKIDIEVLKKPWPDFVQQFRNLIMEKSWHDLGNCNVILDVQYCL